MRLLVTGGAGFIGANFVRHMVLAYPDYEFVILDKLTYAGHLENLQDIPQERYHFIKGDICDPAVVKTAMSQVDAVVHFAAESHVDRSITGAQVFIKSNVLGTQTLLDVAREQGVSQFVHVSTDEVYGSLGPTGYFTESSQLAPNSPYSASKAGSDLLARAAYKTYGLPVVVTRCSNNYGPFQFPEKLIPLMVKQALSDQPLPVYGDGKNVRDWIYVKDHCKALDRVLHEGEPGAVYNIGSDNEWANIDLVRLILKILGKPDSLIEFVTDRPGHDRRYAIDSTKIQKSLNWRPETDFETGLRETVEWYVNNRDWAEAVQK